MALVACPALACGGIAAQQHQRWRQGDCILSPLRPRRQPSRRRFAARRAAASATGAAATGSSAVASQTFEQLYAGLAGVLAPGAAVAARPTPLGRGLVAEQPAAAGDVLLSGECNVTVKRLSKGLHTLGSQPNTLQHVCWARQPSCHNCWGRLLSVKLPFCCSRLVQPAVRDRSAQADGQRFWEALPGGLADAARAAAAAAAALPAVRWAARGSRRCAKHDCATPSCAVTTPTPHSTCPTNTSLSLLGCRRGGRLVPPPRRLAAVAEAQRPGALAPLHRPAAQGGCRLSAS